MKTNSESGNSTVALVVGFYFFTSILLVLLNKFMLSSDAISLDAPLFLTWTQVVVAVVCCYLLSTIRTRLTFAKDYPAFAYDLNLALKVAPLTCIFLGMIIFNNLCLKYVEVSFYQVARSLTIVFNILFTFFVLGEKTSRNAIICCGVVVVGYVLGVDGEIRFSLLGSIFGVASSLFVCLNSIYVKQFISLFEGNEWKLMMYNNINAMFMMPIIFVATGELPAIRSYEGMFEPYMMTFLLITGLFGFLINIATFLQIKYTSPLTHNVSGTAKAGVQTMLGLLIWQNPMSNKAAIGTILTIVGCGLYSYVRYMEMQARKLQEQQAKLQEQQGLLQNVVVERTQDGKL